MVTDKNVSLVDYYKSLREQPLPSAEFIKKLKEITHRSEMSVRNWVVGRNRPDINTQILIAEHMGCDVETLFPPINI